MGEEKKKMNENLTRWNTFRAMRAKTIELKKKILNEANNVFLLET
jgi:hypothetical protein